MRGNLAVQNGSALKYSIRLRNDFLPVLPLRICGIHHERMKSRRILVRQNIKVPFENFAVIKEVLAAGDLDRRSSPLHVLQIHFTLRPPLENRDEQPAIIIVCQLNLRDVLCLAAFPKNQRIFGRIAAQRVIENFDVIDLFSGRHVALFRMAAVVET